MENPVEPQGVRPDQTPKFVSRYSFSYLKEAVAQRLHQLAGDPRQVDLSKKLMSHPEFRPTGSVQIDDTEFLVGKVIKGGDRDQAIMYVNVGGKLMPRALYKSMSDGGWRSCPGFDGGLYSKGNGIHYTQETKPHEDLVRYLEEAEATGHTANYNGDVLREYFNRIKHQIDFKKKPEWDTFDTEVKKYDDGGVLKQFQEFPPGYYTHNKYPPNTSIGERFGSFDFSQPALKGFVPDFSQPPVRTDHVRHTLLGPTTMETYTAVLNGRPIEWVMARDKSGKVWVDRIAFLDKKVNSYGVSPEVIDSGALTNKPIEYKSQIGGLKWGEEALEFGGSYADITPLLDRLPPIQAYRRVKGIAIERVPDQVKPLTIESAKSFDELTTALGRIDGIQGSSNYFTTPELMDLVNKVRRGELQPEYLTRTQGLRDAVVNLMQSDRSPLPKTPEASSVATIADAKTFEQLNSALDRVDGLQGSREYFSAENLKDTVDKVRRGILDLGYVTRTNGLRDTVERLVRESKR